MNFANQNMIMIFLTGLKMPKSHSYFRCSSSQIISIFFRCVGNSVSPTTGPIHSIAIISKGRRANKKFLTYSYFEIFRFKYFVVSADFSETIANNCSACKFLRCRFLSKKTPQIYLRGLICCIVPSGRAPLQRKAKASFLRKYRESGLERG